MGLEGKGNRTHRASAREAGREAGGPGAPSVALPKPALAPRRTGWTVRGVHPTGIGEAPWGRENVRKDLGLEREGS